MTRQIGDKTESLKYLYPYESQLKTEKLKKWTGSSVLILLTLSVRSDFFHYNKNTLYGHRSLIKKHVHILGQVRTKLYPKRNLIFLSPNEFCKLAIIINQNQDIVFNSINFFWYCWKTWLSI